jgi:uncharacterized cupredoxin-like copper-binding protein
MSLRDKRHLRRVATFAVAAVTAVTLTLWLASSVPAQTSTDKGLSLDNGPNIAKTNSSQRATKVTVAAGSPSEFRFKLSKLRVPAGVVTFVVRNTGHLPHDFKIAGKRTKLLQPGKSQTLKVTFGKRGAYRFLCTVTGHAAAGMKGTLKVT